MPLLKVTFLVNYIKFQTIAKEVSMGKKNPTKSTTKKKAAAKKKAAPKKELAAKKNPVKKKTPAVKKQTTVAKKKTVSIPELLKLKFDAWQPEKLFTVEPDKAYLNGFSAPPIVDDSNKEEADRIKALLFKTIDLTVPDIKEEPEKEVKDAGTEAAPAEPVEEKPVEEKTETEPAKPSPAPQEPKETVPPLSPVPPVPPPAPLAVDEESEPMNPALKMLIGCLTGLFALLFIASYMNANNYYLKPTKYGVEILKGVFSPSGQKIIASMPGATVAEPAKKVYSKNEVNKTAFSYFIKKAEKLSNAKGLLDFVSIKSSLNNALTFATGSKHQKDVKLRINKIDMIVLEYKADEAARKKTMKGYQFALKLLNNANRLSVDKSEKVRLDKKINSVKSAIDKLTKKAAPKSKVAPKKTPAKQKTVKDDTLTPKKTEAKPAKHH